MKYIYRILLSLSVVIFITTCKNNPESSENLHVDDIVLEQASFGFEANEMINTGRDIDELTGNTNFLEDQGLGNNDLASIAALKKNAGDMIKQAQIIQNRHSLRKAAGDTLTFFKDDTTSGVRTFFNYNTDTGIFRLYTVKYAKFFFWQVKTYDSSEIKVNYNFTLNDNSDDKLISIENLTRYKDTFFIKSIASQVMVTDYNGTEPSGLVLQRDSYYKESRFLQHLSQSITIHPDHSGTLHEDFEFNDGKTAYNNVTFFNNYTGEFSRQLRNGTTISGTFNSAQDDQQGSWFEEVDLPEGRYIDQILRSAQVSLIDSVLNASFAQQIIFSSGRTDSLAADFEIKDEDGTKTTQLTVQKVNGAHGHFTISETADNTEMSGEWTTWNNYFIESEAQYYVDGSSHLIYRVYAPPYNPGDTPIIVAEYNFSPDDSGDGTLSYNGITYLINFTDNLHGQISRDGKKTNFNLFQ